MGVQERSIGYSGILKIEGGKARGGANPPIRRRRLKKIIIAEVREQIDTKVAAWREEGRATIRASQTGGGQ